METNPLTILCGDALEQLRTLPDESVHCCVTSPPYWGLRDYGTAQWEGGDDGCDHLQVNDQRDPAWCKQTQNAGTSQIGFKDECGKCGAKRIDSQLGLEKTPEEYVAKMVEVFREVRRVLRKDGTLWLNLGDSYAGQNCGSQYITENTPSMQTDELLQIRMAGANKTDRKKPTPASIGLKPKDLCGIPWRVAFALQADGWWLRSDIIWAKPNPMPESVTDRPTKAHEYLFLLTKASSYFYDAEAIREPAEYGRREWSDTKGNLAGVGINGERGHATVSGGDPSAGRNKRSVWTVATAPYPEAHFATYPPDLIKPCILAGTSAKGCCAKCGSPWERVVERTSYERNHTDPKKLGTLEHHQSRGSGGNEGMIKSGKAWNDFKSENPDKTIGWEPTCFCDATHETKFTKPCTVLDPFAGSGTSGMVALELSRRAILIELNPKYVELIKQRCNVTIGLALD